jgi:paraquat-inducible protein A
MLARMSSVIVCHACDLAHRLGTTQGKARVRCVRCRAELYRTTSARIDTVLALAATALTLLFLSNAFPLVELQLNGASRSTTLLGAAAGLYDQGYAPIAALVVATTLLVPLFQISTLLYVLVPLRKQRRARGQNELFRMLTRVVKLAAMAHVIPGVALFAYGALMLTLAGLTSLTPTEQFWRWVEGHDV